MFKGWPAGPWALSSLAQTLSEGGWESHGQKAPAGQGTGWEADVNEEAEGPLWYRLGQASGSNLNLFIFLSVKELNFFDFF